MPTCQFQGQTLELTHVCENEWKVRLKAWDDPYCNALVLMPGTRLTTEKETLIVQVFAPNRRSGAMIRTGTILTV